jgi:hypothetical protein
MPYDPFSRATLDEEAAEKPLMIATPFVSRP